MNTTIKKWGNSLALRIPKDFVDQLEMKEGSKVKIEIAKGSLKIKCLEEFTIDDFMEGFSKDKRHELIEYGDLGKEKEIWQEGTNQDEVI